MTHYDTKEIEEIFTVPILTHHAPIPNLNADDEKAVLMNVYPRNPEAFNSVLYDTVDGITLGNKKVMGSKISVHMKNLTNKYETALDEPDETTRNNKLASFEQEYTNFFDNLRKTHGDKTHGTDYLTPAIQRALDKNAREMIEIEETYENPGSNKVKQELVELKQKILRGDVSIDDASRYLDLLHTAGEGKYLQPKAMKPIDTEIRQKVKEILEKPSLTKEQYLSEINNLFKKEGIKQISMKMGNKGFEELKKDYLEEQQIRVPKQNELIFVTKVKDYLNSIGNPAKLNADQARRISVLFEKHNLSRNKRQFSLKNLDQFTQNLNDLINKFQYEVKELKPIIKSNVEENKKEAEDIVRKIHEIQELYAYNQPSKKGEFTLEYHDKTVYLPFKEDQLKLLIKIAEEGLLYEIDPENGRIRKVSPNEIEVGKEYVKFKLTGGSFAHGYAMNHINKLMKAGMLIHHKSHFNPIREIMPLNKYMEIKHKLGGSFGRTFKNLSHGFTNIAKKVGSNVKDFAKDTGNKIIQNTKELGSNVANEFNKSSKNIVGDVKQIAKSKNFNQAIKGVGNLAKDVGESGLHQLGHTVNYIQKTPVLSQLNTAAQFIPGVGSAIGYTEGLIKTGDQASRGQYGKALKSAIGTVPSVLFGGGLGGSIGSNKSNDLASFPIGGSNNPNGSGSKQYYGSIFSQAQNNYREHLKGNFNTNSFGSAYAPYSVMIRGGIPNYNVNSEGKNKNEPRPEYLEENLKSKGRGLDNSVTIKYNSYLNPYSLPTYLAY